MSSKKYQLICEVCERPFDAGRRDAKTCSDTCRLNLYRGDNRVRGQLVLSLFPGADLLGRAFEVLGFCVVRGPDVLWGGDVRNFHVPAGKFDGIIGGPPCQVFSRANNIQGTRAINLIPEFVRIVEEAKPKWAVMENVTEALPMAPNWPYTILKDFDCGGLTFRTRGFWFFGVAPVLEPQQRKGKPVYSVLASSWMTRNTSEEVEGGMHVHSNLPAEEAARLQGFPGLDKQIMDAQPSSGSTKPYSIGLSKRSREILAIHMLGNGVPRAMGEHIARHIKRQVQRRDDWDRIDIPPYPLFMTAGK